MESADVIIIGGGASGMAAAIEAGRQGERVLLLEKMDQIGKKLLATGNGRCNLMNLEPLRYYGDGDFAGRVFGEDGRECLNGFWQSLGLVLRYDPEGRGYPCTLMAATVMEVLKAEMKRLKVEIWTGSPVSAIRRAENGFRVRTQSNAFAAGRVVIASGGAAQPKLGGNLNAWPWLEGMGIDLVPARPALTPLMTNKKSVSGLSGIRVRCAIQVERNGEIRHREKGELLFSETGVSGICVMQCARFAWDGGCVLRVNLGEDLFPDPAALAEDLKIRARREPAGEPTDLLRGLCPSRLAYAICKQAGIPMRGEMIRDLNEDQLKRIAETFFGYTMEILGPEGFDRAQVMAGGVPGRELNPANLELNRYPGLHVTGELINVDGDCGGYNLMFAFLTGIRAGRNRQA